MSNSNSNSMSNNNSGAQGSSKQVDSTTMSSYASHLSSHLSSHRSLLLSAASLNLVSLVNQYENADTILHDTSGNPNGAQTTRLLTLTSSLHSLRTFVSDPTSCDDNTLISLQNLHPFLSIVTSGKG